MDHGSDIDLEAQQQLDQRRHRWTVVLIAMLLQVMNTYQLLFLSPTVRTPYHTSILTGEAWVYELIYGHPDRIRHNLGVDCDVFNALLHVLHRNGFVLSRNGVSVEEQLGIFLYTCVTGLSSRLVGERFQRSPDTITRYGGLDIIFQAM
jgi:hypothetical protein